MSAEKQLYDSVQCRDQIRITTIFEIQVGEIVHRNRTDTGAANTLKFGRLTPFVEHGRDVLPQLIERDQIDFSSRIPQIQRAHQLLWQMPLTKKILFTITVDVEACCSEIDLEEIQHELFELSFAGLRGSDKLFAELDPDVVRAKYQIIFLPKDDHEPEVQRLLRMVYRANVPVKEDIDLIRFPAEMNRNTGAGAVLSSLGAVVWGQQDYVENLVLLSALSSVSAISSVREVQEQGLKVLKSASEQSIEFAGLDRASIGNQNLSAKVSVLKNELAMSIDSLRSLFPIVPSLRPNSFHEDLFIATGIDRSRERSEAILARAAEVVSAKSQEIDSLVSQRRASRNQRWTVSVTLLSSVAVPISVILGFFGASVSEVNPDASMFSLQDYGSLYLVILASLLLLFAVHFGMYCIWRHRTKELRRTNSPE